MIKPDYSVDYYEILEVSPNASHEVIQKAYKALVQKYHPDQNDGSKEAETAFKTINDAYGVLSQKQLRTDYDKKRDPSVKASPTQKGSGFSISQLTQNFGRLLLVFIGLGFASYYGRILFITPIGKVILIALVALVYFKWVKPKLNS